MKKINRISIAFLCFSALELSAQEISPRSYYSFDRIESKAPWLLSSNGAGLVYNTIEKSFSNVEAYYNNVSGDYKNYNEAKSIDNIGLETKSYTKLKNLYFYGSFNYDYAIKKDQTWLGTTYENTNLNPILDSIPGKNIREAYRLKSKVAYKISDLFSIGAAFNYETATSAKRTDGRNKNEFSNLFVSPGISFTTKYLNVGLNLSYGHNAENVQYEYYGEIMNKNLCYMEGLFMYVSSPYASSLVTMRRYEKDIFGGALQLEFKLGGFTFYHNLRIDSGKENDYEDQMFKKKYAMVSTLNYDYFGELKYSAACMDNSIRIRYSSQEDLSYGISNNYEQVPNDPNSWEYYEYGKSLRYMAQLQQYGIEYHGFIKKNEYLSKIDFTIGYNYTKSDKKEKIFPSEYEQNNNVSDFYASIRKNFVYGNNIIRFNLCGGIAKGEGNPLIENNPLTTGALKLNKGVLAQDYIYRVSDHYRIGGGVNYSYVINKERGQALYVGVNYLYRKLNKVKEDIYEFYPQFAGLQKSSRSLVNVTLGFNF
ncbi:MAG: hypothetical protein RR555_04845 [Bacteroidales bacterium]